MRGVPNKEICRRISLYVPANGVEALMKQVRHAAVEAEMGIGDWVLLAMREKLLHEKVRPSTKAAA